MEIIKIENDETALQSRMSKILKKCGEERFNPYYPQPYLERVIWSLLRSNKKSWEEKLDEAIKKEFLDTPEMRNSNSPAIKKELEKLDKFKEKLLAILKETDK